MKYLHVIATMDPRSGGPCQGLRNLAPRALDMGHSVEVVCLDEPDLAYLQREKIRVHALGKARGAWCYHPGLRPWLEANLSRFDAVILNGLWLYPGFVLSRLQRYPNMPPYFVFPHGMLDPWFQRAPGRRLKAVRNWFYWKLIEQHVVRRAKAMFFTCAEELRLAQETFQPYQPQHQVNVGYGVEQPPEFTVSLEQAFIQKCPGLNGRPYFLFLSRIHPKKGLDLLIKAYGAVYHAKPEAGIPNLNSGMPTQAFSASSPDTSCPCLVIAGPGLETEYGQQMQQLAADTLPPNCVFWTGMLTGDAKWGALYRSLAFVLTSHQENFGISVVEALACGKPVLISNQINIWREIEADRAGLVGHDTLGGTEQLLRRWEGLPGAEKVAMSLAAKSSFLKRYSVGITASTMIETMENLVKT